MSAMADQTPSLPKADSGEKNKSPAGAADAKSAVIGDPKPPAEEMGKPGAGSGAEKSAAAGGSKPIIQEEVKSAASSSDAKPAAIGDSTPASEEGGSAVAGTRDAKPATTEGSKPAAEEENKPATASTADARPAAAGDSNVAPEEDAKPGPGNVDANSSAAGGPKPTEAGDKAAPNADETKSAPTEAVKAEEEPKSCNVKLTLTMLDFAGDPIPGLPVRIVVNGAARSVTTDGKGQCPPQEDLPPGSALEIHVRKDDGSWSNKYQGHVSASNMDMCAVSPHIKIPVQTELHQGAPAAAKTSPSSALQHPPKPNPPPPGTPTTGGVTPCKKPEPRRNEEGHPVARLKENFVDWAERIGIPTFGLWTWNDFKSGTTTATKPVECSPSPTAAPQPAGQTPKSSQSAASQPKASQTSAQSPKPAAQTAPSKPSSAAQPSQLPQPRSAIPQPTLARVGSPTQPPPPEVLKLIAAMEELVTWDWKAAPLAGVSTAQLQIKLSSKTLDEVTAKDAGVPRGFCYKSVKIGLWRAEYVSGAGGGEAPSKEAKAWLLSQGFIDVTTTLPDARWAWPGDVIVYRYPQGLIEANDALSDEELKAATVKYQDEMAKYTAKKAQHDLAKKAHEEAAAAEKKANPKAKPAPFKQTPPKEPVRPAFHERNHGHIDVRSYDGYLSDFLTKALPSADNGEDKNKVARKAFVPIGIYRKHSDPLPELRLRAFLKVLREWECHEEHDDARRYYLLQQPINGSRRFTETNKHPQDGVRTQDTFAGAYQISIGTFKANTAASSGIPPLFTPEIQDRIAVRILEGRKALGAIRLGNIEEAVALLRREWTSLPGAEDARKGKSLPDLLSRYEQFMQELVKQ